MDIANQRYPPYKYEELKIALLSHEDRSKETSVTENVMAVRPNWATSKARPSGAAANSASGRPNFSNYRPSSNSNRKPGVCFECGEPGHIALNCDKGRPSDGKSKLRDSNLFRPNAGKWCNFHRSRTHNTEDCKVASGKKSDNHVKSADDNLRENNYTFHVMHSDRPSEESTVFGSEHNLETSDLLLVDSGCTSHIEKDKPKFESFHKAFKPQDHCIELADGQKQQGAVQGIGTVKDVIVDKHGNAKNILLQDTLYIPGFKQGILSVWKTVQSGHTVTFSPNGSKLTTNDGRVFNIIEKDKLYYLSRSKCDTACTCFALRSTFNIILKKRRTK